MNPGARHDFVYRHRYEILLVGLGVHLFIGLFIRDIANYTYNVWAFSMAFLAIATVPLVRA